MEGLKIDSKYGFNEVKSVITISYKIYREYIFSKIYRKIETKLLCHKPFEILVRYIFNYLPTYRILNVLANRSIK